MQLNDSESDVWVHTLCLPSVSPAHQALQSYSWQLTWSLFVDTVYLYAIVKGYKGYINLLFTRQYKGMSTSQKDVIWLVIICNSNPKYDLTKCLFSNFTIRYL